MAAPTDAAAAPSPPGLRDLARAAIASVINHVDSIGAVSLFAMHAVIAAFKPPYRYGVYIQTMEFVGVGSAGIVLLTGAFTGAVFAIQTAVAFQIFNAKALIGGSVALALTLELAPTMGALMVAGRVGSAMCTELGTMRTTEQIDALETMAVDPVHYLVAPRLIACTLMMPMLAAGFCAIGLGGAYLVSTQMLDVDHAAFLSRVYAWVKPADMLCLTVKATSFGAIIGAIASFKGFHASGGSRGVGLATTSTVVTASVCIFVADYVITTLWLVWFPKGHG
jgi:phospholipid/cholesterol/gamma-HCH transport system permease protein